MEWLINEFDQIFKSNETWLVYISILFLLKYEFAWLFVMKFEFGRIFGMIFDFGRILGMNFEFGQTIVRVNLKKDWSGLLNLMKWIF